MAAGSNLSSDYDFVNDVDYQVPLEDLPDLTRGPVFLGASVLMAVVLVVIMAVCGVGNAVLVATRWRRPRSLADRLVVSLALSDALVALCCPLLLDYYTLRALSWRHGPGLCAAVSYVRTLSVHVSTNALLGIAVDRYLAIVHPLRPRCRSGAVVLGVWLVPVLVSVPVVLTSVQTQFSGADGLSKTFCGQVWTVDQRVLYQTYFLSVMVLQFLVPVIVMATCYSRVCRELWFKAVPGVQTAQVRSRLLRRRRTVLVLVLVFVVFVFCWSPYYVFSVLRDFHAHFLSRRRHALTAFYALDCLAMANGVFNTLCFVRVREGPRAGAGTRTRTRTWTETLNTRTKTRATRTAVRLKTIKTIKTSPTTSTRATNTETRGEA